MSATSRILIVDDEPDTCANLADIFTDLGYHVDVAHDGPAALELVRKHSFDVALLDLKMPGMNGLELYRRIREISAGTVAIVVTAYASSETAASILDAGAWQILPKPVELPRLMKLVDEALEQPLLLVVDDDRELCDSLWEVFRDQGYRVALAHDLGDAEKLLTQNEHRVVLIDLKLPTGNGLQVAELVRSHNPDARTLVITGHRDDSTGLIERVMAAGADAVCYKPFDVKQLLNTVKTLTP